MCYIKLDLTELFLYLPISHFDMMELLLLKILLLIHYLLLLYSYLNIFISINLFIHLISYICITCLILPIQTLINILFTKMVISIYMSDLLIISAHSINIQIYKT